MVHLLYLYRDDLSNSYIVHAYYHMQHGHKEGDPFPPCHKAGDSSLLPQGGGPTPLPQGTGSLFATRTGTPPHMPHVVDSAASPKGGGRDPPPPFVKEWGIPISCQRVGDPTLLPQGGGSCPLPQGSPPPCHKVGDPTLVAAKRQIREALDR